MFEQTPEIMEQKTPLDFPKTFLKNLKANKIFIQILQHVRFLLLQKKYILLLY